MWGVYCEDWGENWPRHRTIYWPEYSTKLAIKHNISSNAWSASHQPCQPQIITVKYYLLMSSFWHLQVNDFDLGNGLFLHDPICPLILMIIDWYKLACDQGPMRRTIVPCGHILDEVSNKKIGLSDSWSKTSVHREILGLEGQASALHSSHVQYWGASPCDMFSLSIPAPPVLFWHVTSHECHRS